ncbi:hypothetical protein ACFW1A_19565 [Kitasatospora sp. NPDC058965]|uniref:hypothetical protein n=1 Tax=Kitasatospora sp. NPDC058965 TaxID=3346682 RepID=UPI0036AD26A0
MPGYSSVTPLKSPIYVEKDLLGGSGSGGDTTPVSPARDPRLDMLWTAPPPIVPTTGKPDAPTNGGTPITPPTYGPFKIDLGGLTACEQSMLNISKPLVDEYNALHVQVISVLGSDTFWGQQAQYHQTYTLVPSAVSGGAPVTQDGVFDDKGVQDAAHKFAPVIGPEMTRALRQFADAMEAVGTYTGLLNMAGQAYASADFNSILPTVTPPAPAA